VRDNFSGIGKLIEETQKCNNALSVIFSNVQHQIRLSNQVSFNAGDNDYDFGNCRYEKDDNSLLSLDPIV